MEKGDIHVPDPSKKPRRVNTEPLAASMLLPVFVEEGTYKPSVAGPESGGPTPSRP